MERLVMNLETGELTVVPLTEEEIAELQALNVETKTQENAADGV